jgi:hypothetical protein
MSRSISYQFIDTLLKSEANDLSLEELRSLLDDHLEIADGSLSLTGEDIRLIATGDLVLEDGRQQVSLDAIAYAFNTCTRLERQMSALVQILIEKEGAGVYLSRLRAVARSGEEEPGER